MMLSFNQQSRLIAARNLCRYSLMLLVVSVSLLVVDKVLGHSGFPAYLVDRQMAVPLFLLCCPGILLGIAAALLGKRVGIMYGISHLLFLAVFVAPMGNTAPK